MSAGEARIRKVRHPDRFVRVVQRTVDDSGLSFRALGVLVHLLARPDDWRVSADRLAADRSEGRDAVRAAMAELEAAGYVRRVRERGDKGQMRTIVYVYETPSGTEDGLPGVGSPGVGSPGVGFPGISLTTDTNDRDSFASPPAAKKQRARDPLWDAVCEAAGIDPNGMPRSQAADVGKTVRDLREVGAEPEQVRVARREWTRRFPGATFTHRVLRTHWGQLVAAPAPARPTDPDLEGIAPL